MAPAATNASEKCIRCGGNKYIKDYQNKQFTTVSCPECATPEAILRREVVELRNEKQKLERKLNVAARMARKQKTLAQEYKAKYEDEELAHRIHNVKRQQAYMENAELVAALRDLVDQGEGCITTPPCGDCKWCRGKKLLDKVDN